MTAVPSWRDVWVELCIRYRRENPDATVFAPPVVVIPPVETFLLQSLRMAEGAEFRGPRGTVFFVAVGDAPEKPRLLKVHVEEVTPGHRAEKDTELDAVVLSAEAIVARAVRS